MSRLHSMANIEGGMSEGLFSYFREDYTESSLRNNVITRRAAITEECTIFPKALAGQIEEFVDTCQTDPNKTVSAKEILDTKLVAGKTAIIRASTLLNSQ